MPKINTLKKPVSKDWHKADIKAALKKKGWTLRGLSEHNGLSHGAVRAALDGNSSVAEEIIANVLGVTPKEIWPSRFDTNNTANRRRCNVKQRKKDILLKKIVLYVDDHSLTLQRVGPANSNELNELRALDKKGLAKFLIIDVSTGFIAHKGAEKKLIDDLSNSDRVFSEIVDRSQQGHSLVQIHASNIWLRKTDLTPAQFQQLVREEDLILKNYLEQR